MTAGVLAALDNLGINYVLRGDEAVACCPVHRELHPSWSINIDSSAHNCFACGLHGNLASLVVQLHHVDYDQAVFWSQQYVHARRAVIHQQQKMPAARKPDCLSEAQLALFTSPPAQALAGRNISAQAAALHGILWNNSNNSWVLPIRCPQTAKLLGWQEKGRVVRNIPYGIKKSETLFGLQAFEYGGRAVLVESPLDVAVLASAGIAGALALYGVSMSKQQAVILRRHASKIIFALDNDAAGRKATAQHSRLFARRHISFMDYSFTPGAKDAGEMSYADIRRALGMA